MTPTLVLAEAWSRKATSPGESPITPGSRWLADAQTGNDVRVDSTDPATVQVNVGSGDGVRWRSAAYLDRLRFIEDATYTLSFSARGDAVRPAEITVSRDESLWRTDKWRTVGLRSVISLEPAWKEYRFVFVTHSIVDVGSRLSIIAGHQTGRIWIKDLRLVSGSATAGLQAGQSPRAGTVPIPTDATPGQWKDWLTFLLETEQNYVAEMRAYLRDELKVKAPIVCTQANYGGIAGLVREQASEFIDAHCYWQHPDFAGPTGAWDTAHYTINNTPQLAGFGPRWFGELGGIALLRVAGKPFTVTEVDEPAPSDYACELYPELATFAGLQDWDALFPFDSVAVGATSDEGSIRTFFDQAHHPAKWGFGPFATRVFREGLITPPTATRELMVRAPVWEEGQHVDVLWLKQQMGLDLGFLTDRLSVSDHLIDPAGMTHVVQRGESELAGVRLRQTDRGRVYVASSPGADCIVGYMGGTTVNTASLNVTCDTFGLDFASIGAVALDGKSLHASARILVTMAARAGNQGAQWNTARTSVGDVWGKGGPAIAERVPATIRLHTGGPRQVVALASDGTAAGTIPAQWDDGWTIFSTRDGPPTLHYEIVAARRDGGTVN